MGKINLKTNLQNKWIEEIIEFLKKRNWTIGVMESCTGGGIMNSLTNIPGVSVIFGGGKVVYSNKAKVEAGVDIKKINKYSVFSKEVAKEMAEKIEGEIGIGVTGNLPGEVFVAVRIGKKVESIKLKVKSKNRNKIEDRKRMKREVVREVWKLVKENI